MAIITLKQKCHKPIHINNTATKSQSLPLGNLLKLTL